MQNHDACTQEDCAGTIVEVENGEIKVWGRIFTFLIFECTECYKKIEDGPGEFWN